MVSGPCRHQARASSSRHRLKRVATWQRGAARFLHETPMVSAARCVHACALPSSQPLLCCAFWLEGEVA
eukprot:362969-Chlamydomonas_euryale.AAC.5